VWRKLHAWLAGEDGPGRSALPLGEFLHPVPLVALVLLAVNDHRLKGAGLLPLWLTGKLSDFAGLLFFPLLLTALFDTLACVAARVTGWRVDFSLRRWKVVAGVVATALVFAPLKLSDAYIDWYTRTLGQIGFPSVVMRDPTDLMALVMLPVAAWLGWREIARVPLGRLEVLARAKDKSPAAVHAALADVPGADALAEATAAWLAGGPAEPVKDALEALRARAARR
jgi:hypothetical protein